MANRKRVFDSVFRSAGAPMLPTPDLNSTAPGQPFGGPVPFVHDRTQAPESVTRSFGISSLTYSLNSDDQVAWDRAWHTVTSFLSSPLLADRIGFEVGDILPSPPPAFNAALADVLDSANRLPLAFHTESLLNWYAQHVRYHFLHDVLPVLSRASLQPNSEAVLPDCIAVLEQAHRLYLHGLSFIVKQLDELEPGSSNPSVKRFRQDLHAIISNSISARVWEILKVLLARKVYVILGIPSNDSAQEQSDSTRDGAGLEDQDEIRYELRTIIESLHNFGIGGEKLKVMFAEVMNAAMSDYVERTYNGVWSKTDPSTDVSPGWGEQAADEMPPAGAAFRRGKAVDTMEKVPISSYGSHQLVPSICVTSLCNWVEEEYSPLVLEVIRKLDQTELDSQHVENWKRMSVGRLAGLRTRELFDIVESWPRSGGGLDDLRSAINTPQRRLKLTDVFSTNLKDRLLHPGASTLQILRTYISMIWSFHSLDHSKVLLDRVAYPLQVYLCSREDTVKMIIAGLLSDTEDVNGIPMPPGGDRLVELAILLNKGTEYLGQKAEEDLDWNDMTWIPDPVDAGPGYKRSKNADVIGTLIGVLGSQEVFIKEFQNVIGDNLLKSDGDFGKEMKLLELLKNRFGEGPLQSCEVMMKDIQDSRRVDGAIRRNQNLDPSEQELAAAGDISKEDYTNPEGLLKPSLHAKILSRLFWPQLHGESYRVPDQIANLQQQYEQGFESLKNSRKLTWLHWLGQATVELELLDRVILEEVHTWQATVIWAFQQYSEVDEPQTRRVSKLVQQLDMDEALVRSALNFWASKMVLREIAKDEYAVMETLNQEDRAKSDAQAVAAAAAAETSNDSSAPISNDELTSEKMQMYWQFIQGMLTNSSPQMPLQQIAMMLKMLIADGFPYSNEELQEFLGRKIDAGELELVAGKYRLKK